MFEAFGGVTEILVPDNLRSGVHKAHRYDPDLNQTYHEMALHYNVAVIPTRIIRPRDPAHHRSYLQDTKDASVERLMNWAKEMGPNTHACVEQFFKTRSFPQQAIRSVIGLKRLAQHYGQLLFEKACKETLTLNQYRYKTVENILKHRLYETQISTTKQVNHSAHFRGSNYFKGDQTC